MKFSVATIPKQTLPVVYVLFCNGDKIILVFKIKEVEILETYFLQENNIHCCKYTVGTVVEMKN